MLTDFLLLDVSPVEQLTDLGGITVSVLENATGKCHYWFEDKFFVYHAMGKSCPSTDAVAPLAKSSMNNSAIFAKFVVSLRTVQKIVSQWNKEGNIQCKSKRGRKRTVNTLPMRRIIERRIDREDERSLEEMTKQVKISQKSIQA
ncbi:hypothetical protein NECAME_05785 [Necator americanus]|uniref:Paired domain-containing protein n=1 Tax=Necator americanus TaxID=51031 RepID=W2TZ41_NECAM|nr:hypothetical protein NECAME_05785 [Necator americanus]ETN86939.1 hypothetical protein NECAME_05785 [Necator americanus]